jgi:hypothetical protein
MLNYRKNHKEIIRRGVEYWYKNCDIGLYFDSCYECDIKLNCGFADISGHVYRIWIKTFSVLMFKFM